MCSFNICKSWTNQLKGIAIVVMLLVGNVLNAQPFDCTGNFYLSLTTNGPSVFYEVTVDPITSDVLFNPLSAGNAGVVINAIGYRITDNYIYGIDPFNYNLYRVDATGSATQLTVLTGLNQNYQYFAGEIFPDGQHLYLLGSGGNPYITREMVKVNLDDFTIETIPIPNASSIGIMCTDFSFDPTDGTLYSFDANENRLVTIDSDNGTVDESLYPVSTVADIMGGVFFDAFGNLYGYGNQLNSGIANTFFIIDKNTGEISVGGIGPIAEGKDGCACPYTIDLFKIVYPEVAFPCTEVTYVFEIANASAIEQGGIDFYDEMPTELTITEIVQNPYGGNVISGVGGNILSIEDMTITQGVDSIIVRALVAPGAEGVYKNQSMLTDLPEGLGSEVLSDDPRTLIDDDSTALEIVPLFVDLQNDTTGICSGDTLVLNAATHGVTYVWDNGSTDSLREVTNEGLYYVEVMSGCETVSDTVFVTENTLSISLGPDMEIDLGESVVLNSTITGTPILEWLDPLENSLNCLTCPEPIAQPFFDVEYLLSGVDQYGCYDEDVIQIRVNKDRNVYIPNVFSPNFDGTNDIFYIQGKGFGTIRNFRIFSRWGEVVFESDGGLINDPGHGWDGTFKGKDMNPAVFVYYAEVSYLDGIVEVFAGDITLVR